MCNFENILRFSHFSIALDMSRITHFLAEIMNPKNSASGNFLTFSMSVFHRIFNQIIWPNFGFIYPLKFWVQWTSRIDNKCFDLEESPKHFDYLNKSTIYNGAPPSGKLSHKHAEGCG